MPCKLVRCELFAFKLALCLDFMNRLFFVVGPIYGFAVCLAMKMIVLPLSEFPKALLHPTFLGSNLAMGLLIHGFFVGYPIALAADYFLETPHTWFNGMYGRKNLS